VAAGAVLGRRALRGMAFKNEISCDPSLASLVDQVLDGQRRQAEGAAAGRGGRGRRRLRRRRRRRGARCGPAAAAHGGRRSRV
jgi:hypothetical protein